MTKILIDFEILPPALEKLKALGGLEVETIAPCEKARLIDPQVLRDQEILFCMFPPSNLSDMNALRLVQIGSAGYTQLFNLGLAERQVRCCNAAGGQ